ncbi:MAG TPA: CHAD domain-containing protein [Solirubrobacteraceae bacterium]|nr:CHAD domain-containing protein [Solirubrobacteraceae bacterium]
MALGQLDEAIELLEGERGRTVTAAAVHDTRKALKRLRALVRTLRPELGEQAYARENAILRGCARRLAGVRDAEVMVGTLDDLLARNREQLAHLGAVRRLRAQFAGERDRAQRHVLTDSANLAQTASELRVVRERVAGWQLSGRGMRVCEPGLRRLYRQGRRRYERARRRPEDGRALHLWRKRVKDLRYAAEMLERGPTEDATGASDRHGDGRARARSKQARWLRGVARRADELGELLGEEHDLAVLAERVRAADEPFAHAAGARRTLLKLIARRRRRLRKRALRAGERLYRRRPKAFVRRTRRAYAAQK